MPFILAKAWLASALMKISNLCSLYMADDRRLGQSGEGRRADDRTVMGRSRTSHVTLQIPCRLTGTSGTALENTHEFPQLPLGLVGRGLGCADSAPGNLADIRRRIGAISDAFPGGRREPLANAEPDARAGRKPVSRSVASAGRGATSPKSHTGPSSPGPGRRSLRRAAHARAEEG